MKFLITNDPNDHPINLEKVTEFERGIMPGVYDIIFHMDTTVIHRQTLYINFLTEEERDEVFVLLKQELLKKDNAIKIIKAIKI